MGVVAEARKAGMQKKRERQQKSPSIKGSSAATSSHQRQQAVQAAAAAQAAAQLMAQMSTGGVSSVISSKVHSQHGQVAAAQHRTPHGFAAPVTMSATLHDYHNQPPRPLDPYPAVGSNPYIPTNTTTAGFTATVSSHSAAPMKIVAPSHEQIMKSGKYPEPSPAACGKRKLAEIAAAQMLAGVARSNGGAVGGASSSRPVPLKVGSLPGQITSPPPVPAPVVSDPSQRIDIVEVSGGFQPATSSNT
eukprot:9752879-Ditylum_brightwellii.AAC.1